jgi:hypothetical protein
VAGNQGHFVTFVKPESNFFEKDFIAVGFGKFVNG